MEPNWKLASSNGGILATAEAQAKPPLGDAEAANVGTIGCKTLPSFEKVPERPSPSAAVTTSHIIPSSIGQATKSIPAPAHKDCGLDCTRLTRFLRSYLKPFAIRNQSMRSYVSHLGSLCCCISPTIFRKWTEDGEEPFDLWPPCRSLA